MAGRTPSWALEGRGCFCDGQVKQLTGKVEVWQKGSGEMCFDLIVYGSTAKENTAHQCLSNERILCETRRDGLVCPVTDNGKLTASNPMFYFCKDTFSTADCHEEKYFSILKVPVFSSLKKLSRPLIFNSVLKHNSGLGQETRPSFRVNGNSKFSGT